MHMETNEFCFDMKEVEYLVVRDNTLSISRTVLSCIVLFMSFIFIVTGDLEFTLNCLCEWLV